MIKVLVADDSSVMRKLIIKNLRIREMYEFVEVADGEQGLNALDDSIQLVLTDWNMPNMNGLEFLTAIRNDPKYEKLPVIMITSEGAREEVITAVKAGVNDFIVKPFDATDLITKVENLLQKFGHKF